MSKRPLRAVSNSVSLEIREHRNAKKHAVHSYWTEIVATNWRIKIAQTKLKISSHQNGIKNCGSNAKLELPY